jgi:fructokinase
MKNKKITAIGNAIVDIVCEVEDSFLDENLLIKGSMSLIDEAKAVELANLKAVKTDSGGSAGNTIAAIAQLGCKASFIGKVANDDFGHKFVNQIEKAGVKFSAKNRAESSSAQSFILVTKDGQRTMCTFLGCASQIFDEDIRENDIKDSEIIYLEGYLWDQESTIKALKKSIELAKKNQVKIAFTLSDSFCVSRHKKDFLSLINNDLDILFANEDEIKELLGIDNIEANNFQILKDFFAKNPNLIAAITRGEKGCVVFQNNQVHQVNSEEIITPLDTTGAGDCFAAGFLFGLVDGYETKKAAWLGNSLAAKIIQKFGARFIDGEI